MNQFITYDEAAGVLRTPSFPPMARPDFASVRALRKHMNTALGKLECPQSLVYRWTGLAMDRAMYALIKVHPFVSPPDPGPTPVYAGGWLPTSAMEVTKQLWENARHYFLLYQNVQRACFRLLDELVQDEYKVSNMPGLNEWNSSMTIQEILSQLETTFGRSTSTIVFNNNTRFTSPFDPRDTPEYLFRRVEECQEIAILGGAAYTVNQIMGNTMYLLLQAGIFPTREFEAWDAVVGKTWPVLKTFVQAAFQRRLVATGLRNTSGQQGYAANQNAFQAFESNDDSSVDTTTTNIAPTANTTGSTLGQTYNASTVPDELAAAIRTIADNQQALYQHIAPLSQQVAALSHNDTLRQAGTQATFPPPPINQLHVPAFGALATDRVAQPNGYQGGRVAQPGGYQQGRGNSVAQPGGNNCGRGYGRGRGRYSRRTNRGGRGRTAFADYVPSGRGSLYGASGGTNTHRPFQSNMVKTHNNWNVCYSCGFNVEDGHDSMPCHMDWRKPGHNVYFTRPNAQQKLDAGCNACTRGIHKSILPGQA
jgi:hypothetical protein